MNLEITAKELKEKIDKKEKIVLLDVRTEREFKFNRIEDSVHIPLDKLEGLYTQLEKKDEIIVYCHHGMRSMSATQFLISRGFHNVKSLAGGIHSWSLEIDSSIPLY